MPKAITAEDLCKEKDIQRTCEDLLCLDGWSIFRLEQNYSERKRRVVGEAGAPDALCVRYPEWSSPEYEYPPLKAISESMFIEWKRKNGRVSTTQKLWHAAERAKGALVLVAGEDFPPTIEGWMEWYRNSGLERKKIR